MNNTCTHLMRRSLPSVRLTAAVALMLVLGTHSAFANGELDVANGSTDLTVAGSYTQNTVPNNASDLTFQNLAFTTTAFTVNTSLVTGTLDDLDATQPLSISNTGATATMLTLSGGTNSAASANGGAAGDLIYVVTGATLTLTGGSGATALGLALTTTAANGNFDIAGTATISSIITGTGFGFTKTGAGSLTLSGANSYTGGTTLNGGTVQIGNATALGTGTLTLTSGTVDVAGNAIGNSLAANGNATINNSGTAANLTGALTGSGTLGISGAQITLTAAMTTFTGTVNVTGSLRLNNNTTNVNLGSVSANFNLGSTGSFASRNAAVAATPINLGSLSGSAGSILNGEQTGTGTATYSIGALNTSTTFGGTIQDNSGNPTGLSAITKTGSGTWNLTGTNTYTGATTVSGTNNAGALLLNSTSALPGGIGTTYVGTGTVGSNLIIKSGAVLGLGVGDFTRALGTGSQQVQFTGSGGFAAYNANRSVNLGGAATPMQVTWGTAPFAIGNLFLGATDATNTIDFQNPINLPSGTRNVIVADGSAAIDAKLSGVLSGAGTLVKGNTSPVAGAGTLILTASNTYTGGTTVNTGTLIANADSALGTSNVTVIQNSGGTGGILTLQSASSTPNIINDAANLFLTTGGDTQSFVNLNFSGTETIVGLSVDGTFLAPNMTYGGVGSGAQNTTIAAFAPMTAPGIGSGMLLVTAPEPSQWVAFGLGMLGLGGLALRARRRQGVGLTA